MAFSTILAIVGDFEVKTIGASEESCPIVESILRVEFCIRSFDTGFTKLIGTARHNISD